MNFLSTNCKFLKFPCLIISPLINATLNSTQCHCQNKKKLGTPGDERHGLESYLESRGLFERPVCERRCLYVMGVRPLEVAAKRLQRSEPSATERLKVARTLQESSCSTGALWCLVGMHSFECCTLLADGGQQVAELRLVHVEQQVLVAVRLETRLTEERHAAKSRTECLQLRRQAIELLIVSGFLLCK